MTGLCRARHLLWTSLGTVCSSSTPGSSLGMADFHKSHLPHWIHPSCTTEACGSICIFLPSCLARTAVCLAQVGGKKATSLGARTDACCGSFDREFSHGWLHSPFLLGLCSFLACLLSDAQGSAQGCPWNLERIDYLWQNLHETTVLQLVW